MTASILRIPNEPHMAAVRDARRERGLWITLGFMFRPIMLESTKTEKRS